MTGSGTTGSGRWTGGIVTGRDGLLSFMVIIGTETDSLFCSLDFNRERKDFRGLSGLGFSSLLGVVNFTSTRSSVFITLSSDTAAFTTEGFGEKGNL